MSIDPFFAPIYKCSDVFMHVRAVVLAPGNHSVDNLCSVIKLRACAAMLHMLREKQGIFSLVT